MIPTKLYPRQHPTDDTVKKWGACRNGRVWTPFGWRRVPSCSGGALDAHTPLGTPYQTWTEAFEEDARDPGFLRAFLDRTALPQTVTGVPADVSTIGRALQTLDASGRPVYEHVLTAYRAGGAASYAVRGGTVVPLRPGLPVTTSGPMSPATSTGQTTGAPTGGAEPDRPTDAERPALGPWAIAAGALAVLLLLRGD